MLFPVAVLPFAETEALLFQSIRFLFIETLRAGHFNAAGFWAGTTPAGKVQTALLFTF